MPSIILNVLERVQLSVGATGKWINLSAYNNLQVQWQVHSTGEATAGYIELQHSGTDEQSSAITLGATLSLIATGNTFVTHGNFLGFVRWYVSDSLNGTPVVSATIIAKE